MKLPNISTKTGDDKQTSLYSGERIDKNSAQIRCLAELDLFDSTIGLAYSQFNYKNPYHCEFSDFLSKIQERLIQLKGEIATSQDKITIFRKKNDAISDVDIQYLENAGNKVKEVLESENYEIDGWIQYGEEGNLSAWIDYLRALCRKSEIEVLNCDARKEICIFLNRLSDVLYWIGRICRE